VNFKMKDIINRGNKMGDLLSEYADFIDLGTINYLLDLMSKEEKKNKEEMGFDKEEFNPFDQEILETIIPTQKEFENLVQFVMNLIRKGEIEFGEMNTIDLA